MRSVPQVPEPSAARPGLRRSEKARGCDTLQAHSRVSDQRGRCKSRPRAPQRAASRNFRGEATQAGRAGALASSSSSNSLQACDVSLSLSLSLFPSLCLLQIRTSCLRPHELISEHEKAGTCEGLLRRSSWSVCHTVITASVTSWSEKGRVDRGDI